MSDSSLDWHWDKSTQAWLTGTSQCGCGVFRLSIHKWTGNVSASGEVIFLGEFPSKEEAIKEAEAVFHRLTKNG